MNKFLLALLMSVVVLAAGYFIFYPLFFKKSDSITIHLGWIGPLTGSASFLGTDSVNAARLAVEEYNQTKSPDEPDFDLIVADDSYQADKALSIYQKMVAEKKVKVILYDSSPEGIKLISPYLLQNEIIMIDTLDNDDRLVQLGNTNLFLIAKKTEMFATILVNSIIHDNSKRVFLVYNPDNSFMNYMASVILTMLKNAGIETLTAQSSQHTSDFQAHLSQGLNANADAYLFLGYSEMKEAMNQGRQMGIKARFYAINPAAAIDNTYIASYSYLDGNLAIANIFLKKYKDRFHEPPHLEWAALQTYDATWIAIKAVNNALKQPGWFIANVRNELQHVKDYHGVSGMITMGPQGSAQGINPSLYFMMNGMPIKK